MIDEHDAGSGPPALPLCFFAVSHELAVGWAQVDSEHRLRPLVYICGAMLVSVMLLGRSRMREPEAILRGASSAPDGGC